MQSGYDTLTTMNSMGRCFFLLVCVLYGTSIFAPDVFARTRPSLDEPIGEGISFIVDIVSFQNADKRGYNEPSALSRQLSAVSFQPSVISRQLLRLRLIPITYHL